MFARISFESSYGYSEDAPNIVSLEILKQLEDDFGELIEVEKIVKYLEGDSKGSKTEYSRYSHKLEGEEDKDRDRELVKYTGEYKLRSNKEYLVKLDTFLGKYPRLKVTIKGVPKIAEDRSPSIAADRLIKKIEGLENRFDEKVEFNDKCEVHVPNLGLLNVNEVTYVEDCCTNELQTHLEKGWRIVAACPQPDQRRPDYVLGINTERNL